MMNNFFDGVKVVDFTANAAGPYGSLLLSDFGADIIKIERPKVGDDTRGFTPRLEGVGITFCTLNRGKKSIVLEMSDPESIKIAKKLIEKADVVIEAFKPGTMDKFGLGYEELKKINPAIIMCSVSAFGQNGPMRKKPGYDILAQAYSGAMDLTGDPQGAPVRNGLALADYLGGLYAFAAISSALYYKKCTGEGQYVDVALLDSLVAVNGLVEAAGLGAKPTRSGNHHTVMAPFGVYEGTGGSVIIAAISPKAWSTLCSLMNRLDMVEEPLYKNSGDRATNIGLVIENIEKWLKSFHTVDEPFKLMDEAGIPCAKVCTTTEILDSEQLKARGMIIDIPAPQGFLAKTFKGRGNPIHSSKVQPVYGASPTLGQHQSEVMKSIGYDEQAIAEFKTKWSISS